MSESTITLNIKFTATADTEPMRALEIARRVGNYIAVELDAAQVFVGVESAFLVYDEPYEARKAETEQFRAEIEQLRKDLLS